MLAGQIAAQFIVPAGAWAVLSAIVIQIGGIAAILVRQRRSHREIQNVAYHVNNVEEDIDHTGNGPTLGQRLKRMETAQHKEWAENKRVHDLILRAEPQAVLGLFKTMYVDHEHAAFISQFDPAQDPPWATSWVNRSWETLTGLDLSGANTHEYRSAMHPDDRERVMETVQEAFERGLPFDLEYRHRLPNGEYVRLRTHSEPAFTLGGDMVAQLGVIRTEPN